MAKEEDLAQKLSVMDANEIARVVGELSRAKDAVGSINELLQKGRDLTQDEKLAIQQMRIEAEQAARAFERTADVKDSMRGMSVPSRLEKASENVAGELMAREEQQRGEVREMTKKKSAIEQALDPQGPGLRKRGAREQMQSALGFKDQPLKTAKELRQLGKAALPELEKELRLRQEILKTTRKQREEAQANLKTLQQSRKGVKGAFPEEDAADGERGGRRFGGRGNLGLMMLSDMNIPGVSQMSRVAQYASMTSDLMPSGGGGGGGAAGGVLGGLGGGLLRGAGLLGGAALGVGALGLGYTASVGKDAYDTAHRMAPTARTLSGQMGGAVGRAGSATANMYGYGGAENLEFLSQLNRQVGGKAGIDNLRDVTRTSFRFGLGREEVAAQAGALKHAGGAAPEQAGKKLEEIMMEGVKGGMDRARITEFTSRVVDIQGQLLQATGENNAQAISKALSQLMRASGRGEEFFRGPAMQAVGGLDRMMKGAGKLQGPMLGTMFRAFGGNEGEQEGIGGYLKFLEKTEGGIFGGKEGGVENIQKILGQLFQESGGTRGLFEKKGKLTEEEQAQFDRSKQEVQMRLYQEAGIGPGQSKDLIEIMRRMQSGDVDQTRAQKEIKDILKENKDPLMQLVEIQGQTNAILAGLAKDGIKAITGIDNAMLEATKGAAIALSKALETFGLGKGSVAKETDADWGGIAAGAAGIGAAGLGAAGVLKMVLGRGAAGAAGAAGAGGGAAAAGGGMAGRIPAAYLASAVAGAGMDMAEMQKDPTAFFERLSEKTGDRGWAEWAAHPGEAIEAMGGGLGSMVGQAFDVGGSEEEKRARKTKAMEQSRVSDVADKLYESGRGSDAEKYLKAYQETGQIPSMKKLGIAPLESASKGDAADKKASESPFMSEEALKALAEAIRVNTEATDRNTGALGNRVARGGNAGGSLR